MRARLSEQVDQRVLEFTEANFDRLFILEMWSRRMTATLMSDGVNTAARLEGIAKPGAIYPSEDAYRQVRAKLGLAPG